MMETMATLPMYLGFGLLVIIATVVDLFLMNRQGAHKVSMREALMWSGLWIALAMVFNAWLWWYCGGLEGNPMANQYAMEFLTGFLIEKSLAVDNIFVFLMIFTFFQIPAEFQKRALIIGVVGAILLRTVMILVGAWLLAKFHWLLYVFGAFLLLTGIKMWWASDQKPDLANNPVMRLLRKVLPLTDKHNGENLSVTLNGKRMFTPLFLAVAMIAITDVIFAVDSIPAIFAITSEPFIVLTSNIFAILGLRAMYFLLAGMADRFHLLSYGLSVVLIFIGIKMLAIDFYKIPVTYSLLFVALTIGVSMFLSLRIPPKAEKSMSEG